jgi:cytochrome c1
MVLRTALAAIALAAMPAHAALYKSVGPNGTITFSDAPVDGARTVELLKIPGASVSSDGAPVIASTAPTETELRERDAAISRASAEVDLAEHALAQARRAAWSTDLVSISSTARLPRADHDRIEFYKKNVLAARQNLMQVLQRRRAATQTMTASLDTAIGR